MMNWIRICIWLLIFSSSASAQTGDSSANAYVLGQDSFTAKKFGSWKKPLLLAGYSTAGYLCYRYLDARIQEESQEHKNGFETMISNSVTSIGLGKFQTIAWASTTAFAFLSKNKKLQKTVIIWAGSGLVNSIVTDQLKKTFQRHRPNSGDAYNVFDWRKGPGIHTSFPSAHTSNAFMMATVFATVYYDRKWVPPVAYGIATLVGLSRIYDNAHWASDVLAGALVGFLSAKSVAGLYHLAAKKITILPVAGLQSASLGLVYHF